MKNELINKLLEISLKIYECYKSLKTLSINKENELYKEKVNNLSSLIKEEEHIYDLIVDRDLIQNILLCLVEKEKINSIIEDINALIDNDISMVKRRIIIKLLNKKQSIDKASLIKMAKEVDEELKMIKKPFRNSYYDLINLLSLSEETKLDFIKGILLIINNDNNIDSNIITNILYNCSLLFPFCEKYLLKNNFNIDENLYFSKNVVADINNMNDEEVANTNKLYGFEIINYYKDKDINEYINIILRTALLFCSREEIKELNNIDCLKDLLLLNNEDICYVKTIRIGCR